MRHKYIITNTYDTTSYSKLQEFFEKNFKKVYILFLEEVKLKKYTKKVTNGFHKSYRILKKRDNALKQRVLFVCFVY